MGLDVLGAGDDGLLVFKVSSMGRLVEVEGWVAERGTSTWGCQEVRPKRCVLSAIGGQCLSVSEIGFSVGDGGRARVFHIASAI